MNKNIDYYCGLNYPIVITEFEDDGEHIYKVKIEELPGLEVYAHTIDEVLSELNEAKNAWFQTALELKREIKEPYDSLREYSGRTTIRMSRSLHKKLAVLAKEENISLNAVINQLLERNYFDYYTGNFADNTTVFETTEQFKA